MSPLKKVLPEEGLDDLKRIAALKAEIEDMAVKAVKAARRKGYSWYAIGPAMGVSRQAAIEKYKPKVGR